MGHSFREKGTVVTTEQTRPAAQAVAPKCPSCGAPMKLERIEPDQPQHDRRMFRCGACGETISETVKYR